MGKYEKLSKVLGKVEEVSNRLSEEITDIEKTQIDGDIFFISVVLSHDGKLEGVLVTKSIEALSEIDVEEVVIDYFDYTNGNIKLKFTGDFIEVKVTTSEKDIYEELKKFKLTERNMETVYHVLKEMPERYEAKEKLKDVEIAEIPVDVQLVKEGDTWKILNVDEVMSSGLWW